MKQLKPIITLIGLSLMLTACGFGCDVCDNGAPNLLQYHNTPTCCTGIPW